MDELIEGVLANGFEDVDEVEDAEPAVFICVLDVEDVVLDEEELDELPVAWLVALACKAARIAAEERFWPFGVCVACGAGASW